MIPLRPHRVVAHRSSQPGVSYSHRKILGCKIIIIIHNILYLIKLTTLYINTPEPESQSWEVNATLAHLAPRQMASYRSSRQTSLRHWRSTSVLLCDQITSAKKIFLHSLLRCLKSHSSGFVTHAEIWLNKKHVHRILFVKSKIILIW